MSETRTVHDPFHGKDVQISNRLTDRLRGRYASGPHLPNGNPEFGWKQFQAPPIQHEAADRIQSLETAVRSIVAHVEKFGCTSNDTYGLRERIAAAAMLVGESKPKRDE